MLDRVRTCALISVRRGLGFATLGIATAMAGFSFDLPRAFEIGGVLALIVAAICYYKALSAPTHDYRRTETWLLLEQRLELPEERRQSLIGTVLQDIYDLHARYAAGAGIGLWTLSMGIRVIG